MRRLSLLFFTVLCIFHYRAEAQAVRYDNFASTTNSACAPRAECPILAIPGTRVIVCTGIQATAAACAASPATTYTSSSGSIACPSVSQLTPSSGGACTPASSNQGNFGWWIAAGTYSYFITTPNGRTYGPSPFTVGGGGNSNLPSGLATQYLQIKPNVGAINTYRFNSLPSLASSDYNFPAQTPGVSLIAGSNTITLSPVPLGVNGTDIGHYLYISGGTGTAEAALITGGTAVSGGSSGTVIVTTANTHSGAWTVQSANFGVQEAVNALPGGEGSVVMPSGPLTMYGPVYAPINVAVTGQSLYSTVINIAGTFPLSASGVFVGPSPTSGDGPQFSNFTIAFTQPDSSSIGAYTHWPAAFYMAASARFTIRNVQVTAAWDVVNMTGNSGGSIIENLQASMFNKGIWIDGSFDSVYLTGVRFWPYALTTNQQTVMFTNPTTYGLYSGRMDDLHVTDFFADCTHGIYTFAGGLGATAGAMENIWIDTNADVTFGGGAQMRISNMNLSYLRMGSATPFTVTGDGTNVQLTNGFFFPGSMQTGSNPWVSVGSTALLQITNSWFWTAAVDVSHIVSSGTLIATDNWFSRQNNLSYTTPIISILAGRATVTGNRALDKGTGAGTFISVATDNWHQIRANNAPGYLFSFPTSPGIGGLFGGVYENDGSYSAVTCMGMVCWGSGDPNGVLTKSPGNIFLSEAGGNGTTEYIKETGNNTNTGWTAVATGGSGAINLKLNGTTDATAVTSVNFTQGTCITQAVSQVSTTGTVQTNIDTNACATNAALQAGTHLLVTLTSSSGTTFTGTMNPTLGTYTVGQVVHFIANAAVSGTPTLNIDTLGAKPLVKADGTTPATATELPSGELVDLWYDGTSFRR